VTEQAFAALDKAR